MRSPPWASTSSKTTRGRVGRRRPLTRTGTRRSAGGSLSHTAEPGPRRRPWRRPPTGAMRSLPRHGCCTCVRGTRSEGVASSWRPRPKRAVTQVAVGRLRAAGVSASGVVRNASRGRISDTIVAEAEALGACAIVMGTPVRRVLSEVLLGSTSLAVARRSPRPVILVKAPRRPAISQRPRRPVPPSTSTQRPEDSPRHRQDGS